MASLNDQLLTYANGTLVKLIGSFKYTAAGNLVDTIRDGHSFVVATVTRVSAGLYEVTFDAGFPIPEIPITERAWLSISATPTTVCKAEYVVGSWNQSTRKFRIVVTKIGAIAAPTVLALAITDPDDQSRIHFEVVGSINSAGTDLA